MMTPRANRSPDGELVVYGGVLAAEEPDDTIDVELLGWQRLRVVPEEEVRREPHELHRHVLRIRWKHDYDRDRLKDGSWVA